MAKYFAPRAEASICERIARQIAAIALCGTRLQFSLISHPDRPAASLDWVGRA